MGIISVEKSDHLFWLGRYVERVFTTLNTFFTYYDRMLDTEKEAYKHFCERLSIPDIYENQEDFVQKYLFSKEDGNSVYSSMERAYDNAVVLRDELSSRTLSYIQLRWTAWRSMPEAEPLPTIFSRFWMTCSRSGAAWMTMWRMRNAAISSSAANIWNAWICICGWIIHTV